MKNKNSKKEQDSTSKKTEGLSSQFIEKMVSELQAIHASKRTP